MKVLLLHSRAGQGHQRAAAALYEEFLSRPEFKPEDLKLMDALSLTRFYYGKLYETFYFLVVSRAPWMWGVFYWFTHRCFPASFWGAIRSVANHFYGRALEAFLIKENPDWILCTHFFPAEVAARLKREGLIRSQVAAVVTDFMAHRFWVNSGTDHYFGMTEETKEALETLGVATEKIELYGIPISKGFFAPTMRSELLKKMDFSSDRFTILISSGSFGTGPIRNVIQSLEDLSEKIQVVVVCGTNEKLRRKLKELKVAFPMQVLGFVETMPELMEVADVIMTRSSGLTTSESLAKGLPMVIIAQIPGQEALNAQILEKKGAAIILKDKKEFGALMKNLVNDPPRLAFLQQQVKQLAKPHASMDIVDRVLEG